ncbi:MAG: lipid A biosynthesis acyltransferase [Ferruginibacter sp.]
MSLWQGKSRGNKSGYRIFIWVLRNFGVMPAYFLLRFVVLYFFLFSFRTSRHLFSFYRRRIGYNFLRSARYLYKNYFQLGQSIIDKVVVMSGIKNNFTFHFDGEDNLRKIAVLQKGGILLSAHIGNWDIAGHLLKRLETRIHIVIFDGEYQKIKEYLDSVTGKRGVNVIVIKNDLSHIYAISDAFKNNELVCMHADRFIEGNKTLISELFGEKARFPMGPFLLAAKFNVPVSFVFAIKESNLHYHFFASEVREYGDLTKELGMDKMLNDFAKEMEDKIKRYPEQWFNYYNFWEQ